MSEKREYFTSRLGFVLSMLGVAIGAGNIWRFSRVVAQNGGGSFLIPWLLFLFLWSIPLLIAEIAMGKKSRKAPIGAFATIGGRSMGWLGAFVALVATGILFYYSVVTGWGLRYFLYGITGTLARTSDHQLLWQNFAEGWQPLLFHCITMATGCWVVYKGIVHGIERSNKILIPTLFCILLVIAGRALTLPGASGGLKFFFTAHLSDLFNYKIWLEALIQNAWDTGAGWGLILVYAGYAQRKESIVVNGAITGIGNNFVSLLMGVILFSTIFALESHQGIQELISGRGSSNIGLAFIFLPKLFQQLPGGFSVHLLFSSLFFLAFFFAALSSMISMVQLTAQTLQELGIKPRTALLTTFIGGSLLGAPSALNLSFFENQDTVWGFGLLLSGLFFSCAILRYGVERYRTEAINSSTEDFPLGKWYNLLIGALIPAQAVVLLLWSSYQSLVHDVGTWWNPFRTYSLGSLILQWGVALVLFFYANRWLVRRSLKHD